MCQKKKEKKIKRGEKETKGIKIDMWEAEQ